MARTRLLRTVVLALLAAACAGAAGSEPTERERVVAGLQAWLDGTERLEARFRQSLVSAALGTTAQESGTLVLERPGKLRWDYQEPDRKIAILLGDRTFLYLADDRQMIRGKLAPEQALFPRLLAGRDRVEEAFAPTLVATPDHGGEGLYRLRLVPRGESSGLAAITLELKPPGFAIAGCEVIDEAGNRTAYRLESVRRNGRLKEGVFAFEPPPGTEIVDQP